MVADVLANLFSLQAIIGLVGGVLGGILIGILPGLGSVMGVAILLPLTFGMEPAAGIIMLSGIYAASFYGGSFTSILLHLPGTMGNASTCLDGYELTKQGKGLSAMGASTICSVIGGVASAIALMVIAPPLARFALRFSAAEFFLIAIFGLTIIGSLAGDNMLKGLLAGALGICVGFVGFDGIFGFPRFTYGNVVLEAGISTIPALIGLFSISQLMLMAEAIGKQKTHEEIELTGKFWPTWKEFVSWIPNIVRSKIIGLIIGIIPGPGGDVASWVSYNEAKRFSKNRALFGKGAIEGVCAGETANNAVVGGSMIPLLTLGIPGSAAAAVILGGFMMHGIAPGPFLFTVHADITYAILLGFLFANILMGLVGILIAKHVVKIANVPVGILTPLIIVLSAVGAFAINNSYMDVVVMTIFGFVGYWMRKFNFATAPVVLGLILGPIAENNFARAARMAGDTNLLVYYVTRPICVILGLLIILSLFTPLILSKAQKARERA